VYHVSVRQHFDAAHYLRGYRGKCEALHGHRFEVVVSVKSGKLNNIGIAYDFVELKQRVGEVLKRFDHVCLNDIAPFDKINPSSENIAATIYKELKRRIKGITVTQVEEWESPESKVT